MAWIKTISLKNHGMQLLTHALTLLNSYFPGLMAAISQTTFSNAFFMNGNFHYNHVIMSAMASQITSITIVYSTVYSMRKSKEISKPRVTGLCDRWLVNSPHKGPITRKMFPFDDVIMWQDSVPVISTMTYCPHVAIRFRITFTMISWASYQIRKISNSACAGNAGNVFPGADFNGNR